MSDHLKKDPNNRPYEIRANATSADDINPRSPASALFNMGGVIRTLYLHCPAVVRLFAPASN